MVKKCFLNCVVVYFNEFSLGFEGGYDFVLFVVIKVIIKENSLWFSNFLFVLLIWFFWVNGVLLFFFISVFLFGRRNKLIDCY